MKSMILFLSFSLLLLSACQKEVELIGTPIDLSTFKPSISFEIDGTTYELLDNAPYTTASAGHSVDYKSFSDGDRNQNAYELNMIFTTPDNTLMPVLTWHKSLSKAEHKTIRTVSNKGYWSVEEFDAVHNLKDFQFVSSNPNTRELMHTAQLEQFDYYSMDFWKDSFGTSEYKSWVTLESRVSLDTILPTREVIVNNGSWDSSGFLKEVHLSFDMVVSNGSETLHIANGKLKSFICGSRRY